MNMDQNLRDSSVTNIESRMELKKLDSPTQPEILHFTVIDPGKFIGWAKFENEMPVTVGVFEYDETFFDWLSDENPDLFVMENYIIRPSHQARGYKHQWGKGEALQVIGAVKFHTRQRGIPLVLQEASIQPISSKRSGVPYKKGQSNDINSAVLHGSHWYFKNYGPHEAQKGR